MEYAECECVNRIIILEMKHFGEANRQYLFDALLFNSPAKLLTRSDRLR